MTWTYQYSIKDLSTMNNGLAGNFLSKFGGYNNLSERNTTDKPSSSFSFHRREEKPKPDTYISNMLQDINTGSLQPSADLKENLINLINREVSGLKSQLREHEDYIENNRRKVPRLCEINCCSKDTQPTMYNSYHPENIERIKNEADMVVHSDYLSLEDIQRMKEEHQSKMYEIENDYFIKKRHGDAGVDRFVNLQDPEYKFKNESKKMTSDDLTAIIRHEEEYMKRARKDNLSYKKRAKSAQRVKHVGAETPLDTKDQRYIKKYVNYLIKKNIEPETEQEQLDNWWNTTKIKSQHAEGFVNRPDGLPGHIYQDDKSFYYLSIQSDSPKSLSVKSFSRGSKSATRRAFRKGGNTSGNRSFSHIAPRNNNDYSKTVNEAQSRVNSHLAFTKLIFNLLNKDKSGYVYKEDIIKNMKLDEGIFNDLGFESEQMFIEELNNFQTEKVGWFAEHELTGFLLSHSDVGEEYLMNYQNHNENRFIDENDYNFDNNADHYHADEDHQFAQTEVRHRHYDGNDDEDIDYNLNKHTNFLKHYSTHERLDKMKESFSHSLERAKSKKNIGTYNSNLTGELKKKIVNKDSKDIKISYKDYLEFLNNYKSKQYLNFTVPKPFEFSKRDDHCKKILKIEEILEERKRKEDEYLNYRFRPNELKREMFINSLGNVIEAEQIRRKMRTEKLKEKIVQEMKPFSFYEHDEKKYKDKLQKECMAPQFLPFKANPIPWKSQVTLYDDILKKNEAVRRMNIEERARKTYQNAQLPPRMEMHEKKKKQQEQELKVLVESQSTIKRSKSFKVLLNVNLGKCSS
jgi:hypothetical protein